MHEIQFNVVRCIKIAHYQHDRLGSRRGADKTNRLEARNSGNVVNFLVNALRQIGSQAGGHVGRIVAHEEIGDDRLVIPIFNVLNVVNDG